MVLADIQRTTIACSGAIVENFRACDNEIVILFVTEDSSTTTSCKVVDNPRPLECNSSNIGAQVDSASQITSLIGRYPTVSEDHVGGRALEVSGASIVLSSI